MGRSGRFLEHTQGMAENTVGRRDQNQFTVHQQRGSLGSPASPVLGFLSRTWRWKHQQAPRLGRNEHVGSEHVASWGAKPGLKCDNFIVIVAAVVQFEIK